MLWCVLHHQELPVLHQATLHVGCFFALGSRKQQSHEKEHGAERRKPQKWVHDDLQSTGMVLLPLV